MKMMSSDALEEAEGGKREVAAASDAEDDDVEIDVDSMDDEEDDDDYEDEEVEAREGGGDEGILAQIIEIREPLVNLKGALERRLRVDLSGHDFWLQDSQKLADDTTLVEQCVQGEGNVQVNVEIKPGPTTEDRGRINIVDVLKPNDDGPGSPDNLDQPLLSPEATEFSSPRKRNDSSDYEVTTSLVLLV